MRLYFSTILLALALAVPAIAWADPPAHAPAHGYRNKHKSHHHSGVEIVFDSERGVHVAVGFPDVFFHEGRFYRHLDGHWQVSVKADGGWSVMASGGVPASIHKAHKHHPGPAKHKHKKK
jgi:hypothetical protein